MIPPELHKIAALLQPASTTNPVRGWGTPVIKRPGVAQAPPAIKVASIFTKILPALKSVPGKLSTGLSKMRGKGGMPPPPTAAVPPVRPPNPFGSAATAGSAAAPAVASAAPATSAVAGAAPSFMGRAAKGVGSVAKGIGRVALPVGIVGSLVDSSPAINAYTGLRDGASGYVDGYAAHAAIQANLPKWQQFMGLLNPDATFGKHVNAAEGALPWFTRAGFGDLTGRMADSYKRLRAAPPTTSNFTSFLPQRGSLGPYAGSGGTAESLATNLQGLREQLATMAQTQNRGAAASTIPPQQ